MGEISNRIMNRQAWKKSRRLKIFNHFCFILFLFTGESSAVRQKIKLPAGKPRSNLRTTSFNFFDEFRPELRHSQLNQSAKFNRDENKGDKLYPNSEDEYFSNKRHNPAQNNLSTWKSRRLLSHDQEINADQPLVEYDLTRISDIAVLNCPCADFCFNNASEKLVSGKTQCSPCYCDRDCGKRLDCCLESLDHYQIIATAKMECLRPRLTINDKKCDKFDISGYNMITKCLNNDTDCRDSKSPEKSFLFPVYSPSFDAIFFNRRCAECNGIFDSVDWMLILSRRMDMFETLITLFSISMKYESCELFFLPPKNMNVDKHICYYEVIKTCNVTGNWDVYDYDIEQACNTINAPVLFDDRTYANLFCMLCNKEKITSEECDEFDPRSVNLAALIDYSVVFNSLVNENQEGKTNDGSCGRFEVRHAYEDECRKVYCPSIALRRDDDCDVFVQAWQTNGYKVHVILTPLNEDDLIPLSAFANLRDNQKRNRKLWFDSAGIPLDQFVFYASVVEKENVSFAKTLDVIIGNRRGPVLVKPVLDLVDSAMKKTWKIRLDKTYEFTATFSRYAQRDFSKSYTNYDNYLKDPPENLLVSFGMSFEYIGAVPITKTLFCEQVELKRHEWEINNLDNVVLNLTTEEEGTKELASGEFHRLFLDHGEVVVRICVDDFNDEYYNRFERDGSVSIGTYTTGVKYLLTHGFVLLYMQYGP